MLVDSLREFEALAHPGPYSYRYCHHFAGTGCERHLVLGCLTHGNEFGTLPAALRLVRALANGEVQTRSRVTILLGNTDAALAGQRFLEEDFNRVFTFDRPASSHERRLAERVRPILDDADVFIDFHQTQTPTSSAFWTFPWQDDLGDWANALAAAPLGLTRAAGQSFSPGTCCLDEYVRGRGRVGLTLEVGERGHDPAQAEITYRAMLRAIALVDSGARGAALRAVLPEGAPVRWFATREVVSVRTGAERLRAGLCNWTAVDEGELLSEAGTPEIRASAAGYVLFPKYPAPGTPPPPELCRLATAVVDPAELTQH